MSQRPSVTSERAVGPSRGLLIAAAGLLAGWFAFLALLAVFTANPVTLNRQQLLDADVVVLGVADGEPVNDVAMFSVYRILAGQAPKHLRLANVSSKRVQSGGRYILPLRNLDGKYAVAPTPPAYQSAPLIYPATDEAIRAAEQILVTAEDPYR